MAAATALMDNFLQFYPAHTCIMKVNDSADAVRNSLFQNHRHKEQKNGFLLLNIVQTADNYSILNSYLTH